MQQKRLELESLGSILSPPTPRGDNRDQSPLLKILGSKWHLDCFKMYPNGKLQMHNKLDEGDTLHLAILGERIVVVF